MNNTIVALLKENEQELQSWLTAQKFVVNNRLVIAETVVLALECTDKSVWSSFNELSKEKGWAYNIVNFRDEVEYWPYATRSVRFDHQGERIEESAKTPGHMEVRQVLHQMITLEPNDPRVKDRLFHAYLLRFEWENQYENGRLHQMRKLIGGL